MPETPATTSPSSPIFPPGRYGRRREPRGTRPWLIAALAILLAGAGTLIGINLFRAYGQGDYAASVTRWGDVTDTQVVVTFVVRLPAGGKARCVVRARDTTGAETGRDEITVSAGPDARATEITHRLSTRTRPVTGEVQGCRPA